ncbi:MAG TPA: hypothetical protein ENK62_03205 [Chromatiales bacterium]|nr:hypothetical protein [Chromatiales bacterium]
MVHISWMLVVAGLLPGPWAAAADGNASSSAAEQAWARLGVLHRQQSQALRRESPRGIPPGAEAVMRRELADQRRRLDIREPSPGFEAAARRRLESRRLQLRMLDRGGVAFPVR